MKYAEGTRRLAAYRQRIAALRTRMRSVQTGTEPQPVDDYVFSTVHGTIRLSATQPARAGTTRRSAR